MYVQFHRLVQTQNGAREWHQNIEPERIFTVFLPDVFAIQTMQWGSNYLLMNCTSDRENASIFFDFFSCLKNLLLLHLILIYFSCDLL